MVMYVHVGEEIVGMKSV